MLTGSTRETRNVRHTGFSVQWKRFMLVSVWKAGMDAVKDLVIIVVCRAKPHLHPPDCMFILDSSPLLSTASGPIEAILMEEFRCLSQKSFSVVRP